jgi:hypothetical protein
MFDFSVHLRENAHLLALLSHYAQAAAEDRTWQPRLMQMGGIDSKELTSLHGDLIAYSAIEPNAGIATAAEDGTFFVGYRITQEGLRQYRRIHGIEVVEETPESAEPSQPKTPRKKRQKNESNPVATSG